MSVQSFLRPGLMLAGLLLAQAAFAADNRLDGYRVVDITSWKTRTAPSAMALVEPLYRDHPYSLEGRPTLKVDLHPSDAGGLVIDLEIGGYLDDSVSGEQFRAIIVQISGGWRLNALGARSICARGSNAGTPTVALCP